MKTYLLFLLLILFGPDQSFAQIFSGPIAKPSSGFGSDGSYSIAIESFSNPFYPTENIRIFHPAEITSSVPTIFYSHGFGGYDPINILGLLNFVTRKGYAIVFVPYQTSGVSNQDRYENLLNGFIQAATEYPSIIDTTRVGFMGHSFGGGATFANAYHCFTSLNWGMSGRFIFASAQWYSLNISQSELQNFPSDVKLLTMVYENDSTNDHRMANEIFNNIGIPPSEKDYLLVKSDTISNYVYEAIHGLPNTVSAFDALDYYGIYRHLDALCDYTFNGSLEAKDVALGNGSLNQIFMPEGMNYLVQSDNPNFSHDESIYTYPCSTSQNPRQEYCNSINLEVEIPQRAGVSVFPNPTSNHLHIESEKPITTVEIYNVQGEQTMVDFSGNISISDLPSGLYLVKIIFNDNSFEMEKFIKE